MAKALRCTCVGGVKEGHWGLEYKEHTQGDTRGTARYQTIQVKLRVLHGKKASGKTVVD